MHSAGSNEKEQVTPLTIDIALVLHFLQQYQILRKDFCCPSLIDGDRLANIKQFEEFLPRLATFIANRRGNLYFLWRILAIFMISYNHLLR